MQKKDSSDLDAKRRFAALQGVRFPAGAVRDATGLDAMAMTNLLSKTSLILCSETAGQGRARQFCLIDVYQLALLRKLTVLSGRVAWSVDGLNRFLFSEVYGQLPFPDAKISEFPEVQDLKTEFCGDIKTLPDEYMYRGDNPWFFHFTESDLSGFCVLPLCPAQFRDERIATAVLCSGVLINITYTLEQVDARLCNYMGIELGDA